MRGAQPPAEARLGQARGAVLARAVDRARGLHREAAQGLFPPLPRQQGAPALRLRDRVHGLRRRYGHGALHLRSRHQIRHARRREGEGQGQHPLGQREARVRGRGAPLRPPLQGPASRRGRAGISCWISIPIRRSSSPRSSSRRCRTRSPKSASSSSGTATSSRTSAIRRPARRSSIAPCPCGTPGRSSDYLEERACARSSPPPITASAANAASRPAETPCRSGRSPHRSIPDRRRPRSRRRARPAPPSVS